MEVNKPKIESLRKNLELSEGLDYQFLLEKFTTLTQQYSGDIWTDYNYHDPGLTLQEVIAFALADLSYRTDISFERIIFNSKKIRQVEKSNLLLYPEEVFPCSPVIINDYKQLLIDQVEFLQNLSIQPTKRSGSINKGLFNIFVQQSKELHVNNTQENLIRQIRVVFYKHRFIGHDIDEITFLKTRNLFIQGEIHLREGVIPENILAQIFSVVENYMNPKLFFSTPLEEEMKDQEIDEVFDGPKPIRKKLVVDHSPGNQRTILNSEISSRINQIEGVEKSVNISLTIDGIDYQTENVKIKEGFSLQLQKNTTEDAFDDGIDFFIDQSPVAVNRKISTQIYETEFENYFSNTSNDIEYPRKKESTNEFKDPIEVHYSIQKDLPSNYGLSENDIPKSFSSEKKISIKQLKGFLYPMDQIMANFLTQLGKVNEIFSVQDDIEDSTTFQIPKDIPNLYEIIEIEEALFAEKLKNLENEIGDYLSKKMKAMNHLISRFSENFPAQQLMHIHEFSKPINSGIDNKLFCLRAQQFFLQKIPKVLNEKHVGFNPYQKDINKLKTSGIQQYIYSKLFITKNILEPLTPEKTLDLFEDQVSTHLKQILKENLQSNALQISEDKNHNFVLFANTGENKKAVIRNFENVQLAEEFKNNLLDKLQDINLQSEGFHLVEHSLLRPIVRANYLGSIKNQLGNNYLQSNFNGSRKEQLAYLEDLFVLAKNQSNYSVSFDDEKKQYQISVYDIDQTKVAEINQKYYSQSVAMNEIKKFIEFLDNVKIEQRQSLYDIQQTNSTKQSNHDDFLYFGEFTILLPDWPLRFQNKSFLDLFVKLLEEATPKHHFFQVILCNPEKMEKFENLYFEWIQVKRFQFEKNNYQEIDTASSSLRSFLQEIRKFV